MYFVFSGGRAVRVCGGAGQLRLWVRALFGGSVAPSGPDAPSWRSTVQFHPRRARPGLLAACTSPNRGQAAQIDATHRSLTTPECTRRRGAARGLRDCSRWTRPGTGPAARPASQLRQPSSHSCTLRSCVSRPPSRLSIWESPARPAAHGQGQPRVCTTRLASPPTSPASTCHRRQECHHVRPESTAARSLSRPSCCRHPPHRHGRR